MSDFLALLRQRSERPLMAPADPVADVAFFERKASLFARLAAEEPDDVERAQIAARAREQLAEARSRLAQQQQNPPGADDHDDPAEAAGCAEVTSSIGSAHAQTSTAEVTETAGSAGVGTSGVQVRAVRAVAVVVATGARLGLASVSWLVDRHGTVSGQLARGDAAGLCSWADAFGAAVDWGRLGGCYPQTTFTVNGVSVTVWTSRTPVPPTGASAATPVAVGGER